MAPRPVRLLPLLLALLSLLAGAHTPGAPAQAADATGQTFAVRLKLAPPAAGVPSFEACSSEQQARLEQLTLQFHLATDAAAPTVTISPSELTGPINVSGDTVPLQSDASGLSFSGARINLSVDQISLNAGHMHLTSSSNGAALNGLALDHVSVSIQTITGDVVMQCTADATGSGPLDTTPPVAFYAGPCMGSAAAGCVLLPYGSVTFAFSKPVMLGDALKLLTVTDDQGNTIRTNSDTPPYATGYSLAFRGAWPLGGTLQFRLAAGVHDLARNAYNVGTPPLVQTLSVVADPGDLDAAGNSGFETGDLSGYTVNSASNRENLSAVYARDAYGFVPAAMPSVVSDFDGITPTEGNFMLSAGSLTGGCTGSIVVLTARFFVPQDANALVLDDAAVTALSGRQPGINPNQGTIVTAYLSGPGGITAFDQSWKDLDGLTFADDGTVQTGWRQLQMDLTGHRGRQVELTLWLSTESLSAPLLPCYTSAILLDNLRFT